MCPVAVSAPSQRTRCGVHVAEAAPCSCAVVLLVERLDEALHCADVKSEQNKCAKSRGLVTNCLRGPCRKNELLCGSELFTVSRGRWEAPGLEATSLILPPEALVRRPVQGKCPHPCPGATVSDHLCALLVPSRWSWPPGLGSVGLGLSCAVPDAGEAGGAGGWCSSSSSGSLAVPQGQTLPSLRRGAPRLGGRSR